jgi:hypothetical protein
MACAPERSSSVLRWLGSAALVLLACGAESQGDPAASGPRGSPGAGAGGSGGAATNPFGVCPLPLGSADELARTPRADTNLELLALTLDVGQLTATQATYERVVADIGALRALAPSLASVSFWPPHDGHTLLLTFGSEATEALSQGTYTAWDCLLDAYRAEIGPVVDIFPTYAPTLYLDGIFDMPRLAELFAQLPDVSVEINATGERRTLCATRSAEHHEYVVDRTNGRCDATGACSGSARHFASDAPGQLTVLESWTASADAPAPDWFRRVCN